jgi:hypothetical protein
MTKNVMCPVCDAVMRKADIPKQDIYTCKTCDEIVQVLVDGNVLPLKTLLERSAIGDDRIRAAISQPKIATVKSFIDVFDNAVRSWKMELGANVLELRSVLAQAENRLDHAMEALSGMDLAIPEMSGALESIREARDLLSTLPAASRGLLKENEDDVSSFTIQTAGSAE